MTILPTHVREVANTIRKQIGVQGFMTLGASDLAYTTKDEQPGLTFKARILPFLKSGQRGTRPRVMRVTVTLSPMDTYDVTVGYLDKYTWVTHYETTGIYFDQLPSLMLALDYNGKDVLNGRYL